MKKLSAIGISVILMLTSSCSSNSSNLAEKEQTVSIDMLKWSEVRNGIWNNDTQSLISISETTEKESIIEIQGKQQDDIAAASATILLDQKTPSPITISGWIRRGSAFKQAQTLVALDLFIKYQDNTSSWWVNSQVSPNEAGKWIFKKASFSSLKPVKSIQVFCLNYKMDSPSSFKGVKIAIEKKNNPARPTDEITFKNGIISLRFSRDGNIVKLDSLKNIPENHDYIKGEVSHENIWNASFNDSQTENAINIYGSGDFSYTEEKNILKMNWNNIDVGEEKAALDVCVSIALDDKKPLSYWHISTKQRTKKSHIENINFPVISGISYPGPHESSYLFYPQDIGRLSKLKELEQKSLKYGSWYMTMQFIHIYGEKGGFYFASRDGNGFLKEFNISRDYPEGEHFKTFLKQTPSANDVKNYDSPYDVTVGIVNGDWYDSAMLYKEWALTQNWCSKGPLHKRKDFPKPLQEIALWLMNMDSFAKFHSGSDSFINKRKKEGMERYSLSSPDFLHENLFEYDTDKIVKEFTAVKKYFGLPVASWSHPYLEPFGVGMPRYLVPKGLSEAMEKLRTENVYFIPWTSARLFDVQIEKWKKDNAVNFSVIDESGNPVYSPCNVKSAAMCMATNYWQNEMAYFTKRLMQQGFTGIYYDELASTGAEMCYSKNHSHYAGGGNYALNARKQILKILHEKFTKEYPSYFSSGEELSEYLIDANDSNFLYGSRFMDSVPAFQVVYHDYSYCYGRLPGKFYDPYLMKFYMEKSGKSNLDELATTICRNFVYGINIGCMRRDIIKFSPEAAEFIRRLASTWNDGKKYLLYGQMLRAPDIQNATPFAARWAQENQLRNDFPTIFSSAWKAPDGTIGIVLANASNSLQTADMNIALPAYGINSAAYIAKDISTNEIIFSSEDKFLKGKIPVPGRSAKIIEISKAEKEVTAKKPSLPPFTVSIDHDLSEARKGSEGTLRIFIENLRNTDAIGNIEITADDGWIITPERKLSIQIPQGKKSCEFKIKLPEETETLTHIKVNVSLTNQIDKENFSETFYLGLKDAIGNRKNIKRYSVTKLDKDIKIDAKLDDWPKNIPAIDKLDEKNIKLDKDELKTQARFAWTQNGLYISFIIDSPQHVAPQKGENVWKGDCIQLAFNIFMPDCDRYSLKNICLFMTADGKPGVYCFEQNYISDNIKLAVSRNGNRTIYEAFIPKFILITLKGNHKIPFSFTINKNDGKGFKGWLEWTPGVCGGSNPEMFGELEF